MTLETDKGKMGCWKPELFPLLEGSSQINVEIEQKGAYTNIVGVQGGTPVFKETPIFKPSQTSPSRDHSIVSQVFVKCANDQLIATIEKFGSEELETFNGVSFLRQAISELYSAYKYSLELLDGN